MREVRKGVGNIFKICCMKSSKNSKNKKYSKMYFLSSNIKIFVTENMIKQVVNLCLKVMEAQQITILRVCVCQVKFANTVKWSVLSVLSTFWFFFCQLFIRTFCKLLVWLHFYYTSTFILYILNLYW